MPDDHSELVPLLPIPNRTVKRLSADDSAGSRVKVGHRQALTARKAQPVMVGLFFFPREEMRRGYRFSKSVPTISAAPERQRSLHSSVSQMSDATPGDSNFWI
jgi:hypothetical protein